MNPLNNQFSAPLTSATYAVEKDKNFNDMLRIVTNSPEQFPLVDQTIRTNEFALAAIAANSEVIPHLGEQFLNDVKFIFPAMRDIFVNMNGKFASNTFLKVVEHVGVRIKNNGCFWMILASMEGDLLKKYAGVRLNDPDFMLMLAKTEFQLLKHADVELLDNEDFLARAVQYDRSDTPSEILLYASKRLRADKKFILKLFYYRSINVFNASSTLYSDSEFALAVLKKDPSQTSHFCTDLYDDRKFMLQLVKHNGTLLWRGSARIKDDREIVVAAIMQEKTAFFSASNRLQENDGDVHAAFYGSTGESSSSTQSESSDCA